MQLRYRHTLISFLLIVAIIPALIISAYLLIQINRQAASQDVVQLNHENRQFSVAFEHALSQIQSQLNRLSGDAAILRSITAPGTPGPAVSRMTGLQDTFPVIDAVLLFNQQDVLIDGVPPTLPATAKASLTGLIADTQAAANSRTETSVTHLKHSEQPELAALSERADQSDYLIFSQPIIQAPQASKPSYARQGSLLIAINIHALVKQLAAQTSTDLSTTQLVLRQDRRVIYHSRYTTHMDAASSIERVLSRLNIAPLQMTLTMERDWDTIHSGLNKSMSTFLWLIAGLLALITAAAFILSKWLTQPFIRLQRAAQTPASDQAGRDQSALIFREFQDLAHELQTIEQTMQHQLGQAHSVQLDLETELQERSVELENCYAELKIHDQLLPNLMQLTNVIQKADTADRLIDNTLNEIQQYFHGQRFAILLNRTRQHEANERSPGFSDTEQKHFMAQRDHWRQQDFDFRTDTMDGECWTLIPLRDRHRSVIGQLILLGREPNSRERDCLVIVTRLISLMLDQIYLSRKLERQANTDSLTGLANRHYFESQFQRLSLKHQEYGTHIGLIAVDVDGLKTVNDNYGHEYGDLLLQRVADQLRQGCRDSDILARVGDDEFYLLLSDADQKTCQLAAERLNDSSESMALLISSTEENIQHPIQFSTGYASTEMTTIATLIYTAEEAMNRNKDS